MPRKPATRLAAKGKSKTKSAHPRLPSSTKTPQKKAGIAELLQIMQRLRSPDGCPWDREQTLNSLPQYLIEECYEVVEALETGDPAKHQEELGDLLLQIVFHSQIRSERGEFEFADVIDGICEKLIRRHPHVFQKLRVADSAEVLRNWDAIKKREKTEKPPNDSTPKSVVGSVPRQLPALHKAHHVQKRAARVGFDWTNSKDVLAKIEEELLEVKQALRKKNTDFIMEEIGDLLFAVANLSRFHDINPEDALNLAVAKFIRRFNAVEERLAEQSRTPMDCTLAELDAEWNSVKTEEQRKSRKSRKHASVKT